MLLGTLRRKDPNVVLAMGFDTDYTDYSRYGHIWTPVIGSTFSSVKDTTSNWYIGAANGTGAGNLNGFMDWIKVTKEALYTAPFTPPTILTV